MSDTSYNKKYQFERWLIPALILSFCLAAFIMTLSFKEMPPILKRGMQPADFPQLLLVVLFCLTCAMAWFDPINVREKLEGSVWGTIGLMGVFVVIATLDLFLALGVFASGLAALWGERRLLSLVLVGIIIPTLIFFLFDLVFEIRFPRGLLTNLWYG